MHFFGAFGVLAFVLGTLITLILLGQKLYNIWFNLPYRNVTDNPLFYLALLGAAVGVQLFLAGFLGELMVKQNIHQLDYIIDEKI